MNLEEEHRGDGAGLEDFWGRRLLSPHFHRSFAIFGYPVWLRSNEEAVLKGCALSSRLFSIAPRAEARAIEVEVYVREVDGAPSLERGDLPDEPVFSGHGDWIAIDYGKFGHCSVDLAARRARAVLAAGFARTPELLSRRLFNTVLTNFMISGGLAMLHASAVEREGRVVLFVAPHNQGKSTTILRLVLAGYRLFSDSQVYVDRREGGLQLTGFPVGLVKLRPDRLVEFDLDPGRLRAEQVGGERKYVLDLRASSPDKVQREAVIPSEVHFCLTSLSGKATTSARRLTRRAALRAVEENSLFYDRAEVWQKHLALASELVDRARLHRLEVGTEPEGLLEAVERLDEGA